MYDDARKAAEKKAREEAWWAAWWDEDFSWDGLADKPWRGWSVTPDDKVVETADAPEGMQDGWSKSRTSQLFISSTYQSPTRTAATLGRLTYHLQTG